MAQCSTSRITVLYTVHYPDEAEDDQEPCCYEVPLPRSGVLRGYDLMARFPPAVTAITPDTQGWYLVAVGSDGSRCDIDTPATPVPVGRDGCVCVCAVPLAKPPVFTRDGVKQRMASRQTRAAASPRQPHTQHTRTHSHVRRRGSQGTSPVDGTEEGGRQRRSSSGDRVSSMVGSGTETAKSLLSAFGGVVAQAAQRLTGPEVTVGDRRFRVMKEIAEGGYSKVFLVRDATSDDGRYYAMKQMLCFHQEAVRDAQAEVALLQELRSCRSIIPLLASGSAPWEKSGQRARQFLLVFPFYARGTAWDAIAAATANGGRPPWPFMEKQALRIFVQACEGVLELHQRGYAHWDIKPHNLLLGDADDECVLMDLGSACKVERDCVVRDRRAALALEELAAAKCSPAYRPPELTQVEVGRAVDTRVDVWALGCTLFALAFGRSPFESPTEGVMRLAILNGRYSFPASSCSPTGDARYSAAFQDLIRFCLEADPAKRPFLPQVLEKTRQLLSS